VSCRYNFDIIFDLELLLFRTPSCDIRRVQEVWGGCPTTILGSPDGPIASYLTYTNDIDTSDNEKPTCMLFGRKIIDPKSCNEDGGGFCLGDCLS
jgi:hypothetical protein